MERPRLRGSVMERVGRLRREFSPSQVSPFGWRISSTLLGLALVILLVALFAARLGGIDLLSLLLGIVPVALCVVLLFGFRFLALAHEQQRQTASALDTTEREFQSVFESVLDTILILDDQGICRQANPAAELLLGASHEELMGWPVARFWQSSLQFQICWARLLKEKQEKGCAALQRKDRSTVYVEFTARAECLPRRHVMILRDITQRKRAEEQVESNLAIAQSAWAEADAMRKATLALTQDLRMDYVLDTLLESLLQLVPYESAQVLLSETDSRLFLAREAPRRRDQKGLKYPLTFDAAELPLVERILANQSSILLFDSRQNAAWRPLPGQAGMRSWLCVPLIASHRILGLLAFGHHVPHSFAPNHVRLAKLLAIPAAAAIQNARLYERAEIYGEELERRLTDLREAQIALQEIARGRKLFN
jgi:PAS domain S-box-containing protein